MRALTIARHFSEHDFLFVSHDSGLNLLQREYQVVECPSLVTVHLNHKVAILPTIHANFRIWQEREQIMGRFQELMERFQPDIALTDYEFFLPWASRRAGLPCLSLDHQHIITSCTHPISLQQFPSFMATYSLVRFLFSQACDYIVTSFFRPSLKSHLRVKLAPPLLRASVLELQPTDGEHVLAYQGYSTFQRFFPFLRAIPRPVIVYGFDTDRTEGNLRFKKRSEEGALADLASCQYVVCGGGHSLISEALYYGKPVISFPIQNAIEQFLNSFYVDRLGYGQYFTDFEPRPEIIPAFEANLELFRRNIRAGQFNGNPEIFNLVAQFIDHKKLDYIGL